jgi:hypothetical protein
MSTARRNNLVRRLQHAREGIERIDEAGQFGRAGPAKGLGRRAVAGGRRRIERLLKNIEAQHLRVIRAIEVVERIGTDETRKLLERLARGETGARLTREATAALGRLGLLAAVR